MSTPKIWPEPQITDNARILLGYLTASIWPGASTLYGIAEVDAGSCSMVIENTDNANTYRLSVVQIGGVE